MYNLNDNFTELAGQIASNTAIITDYLKKIGLPEPNFTVDSAGALPPVPEIQIARLALIDATAKLQNLATGSDDFLWREATLLHHDQAAIDVCNQFDVWHAVPRDGSASIASIASTTKLPEERLRRVLRHAFTMGLFAETSPGSGEIVHTANSAYPLKNTKMKAWIGHNIEEVAAACIDLPSTLRKYGDSQEPGHCATAVHFFPDAPKEETFFDWAGRSERDGEEKGWRVRRFGEAMASMAPMGAFRIEHINAGFDWDSLGEATVVDMGGSLGHASIELASKHPKLKCIVQDFAELQAQHASLVPAELKPRVSFQAHNFFKPQTVVAEVYFLKHILHDWSDAYAVKILSQLLPVMKPGSRVILMECIVPPRGVLPNAVERSITALDLQMMVACNSKERTPEDWIKVFKDTDERFEVKAFVQPPGSGAGLIEVVWKG